MRILMVTNGRINILVIGTRIYGLRWYKNIIHKIKITINGRKSAGTKRTIETRIIYRCVDTMNRDENTLDPRRVKCKI